MARFVVLLSIPGLRSRDLASMPNLSRLFVGGGHAVLVPSFPAVTCPVQANMTTGKPPREHGVVANGFYWRDQHRVEMWTAWNDCIQRPQIWDILHDRDRAITSAVWFPLHSKGSGADYICTPAPVHNDDGSESPWCFTRPEGLYDELKAKFGHFPLQHFWGPLAGIQSTTWIVESAIMTAEKYKPNFFYLYLPHLDYAAQKSGPDSKAAHQAVVDLDAELGKLIAGFEKAYSEAPLWLAASEYVISAVSDVTYPNRTLREAGLLKVIETDEGEHIDFANSKAWALADHQFSHIYLQDSDPKLIKKVARLFGKTPGIAEVLTGDALANYKIDNPRTGDLVLVSDPHSWQAYYFWLDDAKAPQYARTVDIHRKPGYDPVELFVDARSKTIPLNANLVHGSHGAPATSSAQRGVLLTSEPGVFLGGQLADTQVAELVLKQFAEE
ncbi:MAG TPA: nucleotide pyrophosphatase/phosphodiesterase family protein [Lacipirellulaceae bacterium]|jgi:predicted AlkP superfamily pyrophosphatase or phosphodiesterase|nr:nucleotide pyrophosphatase/phosphodiesterase family protein [Lacipirellulaceae bacterium]